MRISAVIFLLVAAIAFGQDSSPELTQKDSPPAFQSKVNLVLVPVVVRDNQGRVIDGLEKADFQVFDRGKPQIITDFTVVKRAVHSLAEVTPSTQPAAARPVTPERYVAYLFDDLNVSIEDLMNMKKAALHQISANLDPSDRAAIYTTSGQMTFDFTNNRAELEQALSRIQPRTLLRNPENLCPSISYYMADLIVNKNDQQALNAATQETLACMQLDATQVKAAQSTAESAARQSLSIGEENTNVTLGVVKNLIRRMSAKPGQRLLVLASPGFLTPSINASDDKAEILDSAASRNVIINTLNVRGLFTASMDASTSGAFGQNNQNLIASYDRQDMLSAEDVLAELADGTGGVYFHNNNDLSEGFKRVASVPEVSYVLGFSPQSLKPDGSFHRLKIVLLNKNGTNLQARRGYYAVKHKRDEEENARVDIETAVYSREEMRDIPIGMQTQFFKPDASSAKLTVVAKVDIKRLKFKKLEGRNRDNLTIVSVLFDTDGNYITGNSKNVEMKLRDETLARLSAGITLKSSFDVKPGTYVVRLVVRDSEGQAMAAQNGAVEIP